MIDVEGPKSELHRNVQKKMSPSTNEPVLPRPGVASPSKPPISGPAEAAFTDTFGTLLPPVKYVHTDNGKAAYYEMPPSLPGNAPQTPDRVLFIHGIQTPALGLLPLVRLLRPSFPGAHFVLADLWGHGLSDTPIAPHDPALFHRLLDALLDRLEWSSAHLVGFSFGGALTAGFVASRPFRVQSFTLIAPAGLIHSENFTAEQQGYLRGGDEAAARKWILEFLEGGELVVPADWEVRVRRGEIVAEAVRNWQMREHPGHAASVVAIFRDGGVLDNDTAFVEAIRTRVPSCVILGGLDDVCTEKQIQEVGFANVAVVPDAGHGVVRDKASEVAALVNDFWTSLHG